MQTMVEKRLHENKEYLVSMTEGAFDAEISAFLRGPQRYRKPPGTEAWESGSAAAEMANVDTAV